MRLTLSTIAAITAIASTLIVTASAKEPGAANDAQPTVLAQADGPMVITPQPGGGYGGEPGSLAPPNSSGAYSPQSPGAYPQGDPGGAGRPYEGAPGGQIYVPPEAQDQGTFSMDEIKETGHRFFGKVSVGFAKVVEYAFQRSGRPNGYILGEEAGGAIIAGLRYGEGVLYTKDAGEHRVFWQGPSLGYDFGAEGSKTMVLVYDLKSPGEIFNTFAGVDGSAYLVGGVGITFLTRNDMVLAPIRSGVGLRLGANVGYLKYTREPTWNPF
ncbi:MAG: DUF1134 domain-containing protein [Methyloceanibacter sp.]